MKTKQKKTILPKTPSATSTNSQLRLLPSQNIIFYKLNKERKKKNNKNPTTTTTKGHPLGRVRPEAVLSTVFIASQLSVFSTGFYTTLPLAKLNSPIHANAFDPPFRARITLFILATLLRFPAQTHTRARIVQPHRTASHQHTRKASVVMFQRMQLIRQRKEQQHASYRVNRFCFLVIIEYAHKHTHTHAKVSTQTHTLIQHSHERMIKERRAQNQ